jgi:hypothetical protein
MARLTIETHVIPVSSLGSLDKWCRNEMEKLLGSKSKQVIDIWCKRLVVAALKGSYSIWLKRCGYKDVNLAEGRRHDPNEPVDKLEVFEGEQRWIDERTQAIQESLIRDEEIREINEDLQEGENLEMDEIIIEEEDPYIPIEDYEAEEQLKTVSTMIYYKHELKWFLDNTVIDWATPFTSDRKTFEQEKISNLLNWMTGTDKDRPIIIDIKMLTIALYRKRLSTNMELNPMIMEAMLRTVEKPKQ